MSLLVSQKDKHQEIIFESCLNRLLKDEVGRGSDGEGDRDRLKLERQAWRQKTVRKKIRVIHQSHPSDNSAAGLHFIPPTPRHAEASRDGCTHTHGISGRHFVTTGVTQPSDCHHGYLRKKTQCTWGILITVPTVNSL